MSAFCYINNIPVSSSQSNLFDLYRKYLEGKVDKTVFINFEGYGDTFESAKTIYNKIMF